MSRFINKVMIGGKKTTAQRVVYDALDEAERQGNRPGIDIFRQALINTTPALEVRSRRVGGATYQVPRDVRPERREALSMRWIVQSARSRSGRAMSQKLATELVEASRGQGDSVRRKEEQHRMAEANRAFAHYRW